MRVLGAQAHDTAYVVSRQVGRVGPGAGVGAGRWVEEAEQDVGEGGLAGAARSDDRDPAPGGEVQVDAAERRFEAARPDGSQPAQLKGQRRLGERGRVLGFADRDGSVDDVDDPFRGSAAALPHLGGGRESRDRLERGERGEDQDGEQNTVKSAARPPATSASVRT